MVGEQATICAGMSPGHDLGPGTVLRIGDGCVIGRGSHIVAHHSIDIGDGVFTGPYVYITDQNHSYADPDVPIGRQWPVNAPVSIGAGTWLGTGVIVLPGARIGRNVVVAAGSVVRGETGDLCVVAGAPARVVKVFDSEAGWTRPLLGSEDHIEALVNEALAAEVLAAEAIPAEAAASDALAAEAPARETLVAEALARETLAREALAGEALAREALAGEAPGVEMTPADHDS